jgi:hypothetical protein
VRRGSHVFGRERGEALKSVLWQAAKFEEYFFTPIMLAMKELMPKQASVSARFRLWWAGRKALAASTDLHFKHNVAAIGIDDIINTDEELTARVRSRHHFVFRTFSRLFLINAITVGTLLRIMLPIYFRIHSLILAAACAAVVLLAGSNLLHRIVKGAVRDGINSNTESLPPTYGSGAERGPLGTTMNTAQTVGARRFRRNCVRGVAVYAVLVALARFATQGIYPFVLPLPPFLLLASYVQARPLLDWEAGQIFSILYLFGEHSESKSADRRWLP